MLTDSINGDLDLIFNIHCFYTNVNGPPYFCFFPSYSFCSIYEVDKINFSRSNVFASLILSTMWHTKHPGHGTKIL